MRVSQAWTNEDQVHVSRLTYDWPFGGQSFSFDLGGIFTGDDLEGQFFLAESKKYEKPSDQGTHFDDWVAKCYVTRRDHPRLSDNFLWITWAPFRMRDWHVLASKESVFTGLVTEKNRKRVFDTDDEATARGQIDQNLAADVAAHIWIIVLSDKQERLVISPVHRSWIIQRLAEAQWSA